MSSSKTSFSDPNFWGIVIIFLLTVHLNTVIFTGRLNIDYIVFSYRLPHLLGTIGASFIVVYTPLFYTLKRRYPVYTKNLLKLHIYGNSTSFMLVSLHVVFFRLINLPLRAGLTLFTFVLLLVITGFSQRFGVLRPLRTYMKNILQHNRFLHVSLAISLYIVFFFHMLNVLDFQ